MPANVHFFSNNPTESYDNFGVLWHLVGIDEPPRQANSGDSKQWKGISEGDLIVFPALLSGAGEFESVRFVGSKATNPTEPEEEVFPLLTAGIEYPEFPALIVLMAQERGVTLREFYESPFNAVLEYQTARMTMKDVFGGEEPYTEFWAEPPVARRRRPPGGDAWRISLGDCVWVRTLDEESLVDATIQTGGGEEL